MNIFVGYLSAQNLVDELNSSQVETAVQKNGSTLSSIFEVFGLLLVLIIILVAATVTTRFLGNFRKSQLTNKNFTFIEAYPVGQGKTLQLIRMGTKYIIIAVCKDKVSLITELSEEDIILPIQEESNEKNNFLEVFNKLNKKKE